MKDLEPGIYRQRLIIEGKYTIQISKVQIENFLKELSKELKMSLLIEPIVFSPNDKNHPIHHGIAGFVGWVESGGSVYTWDKFNFFTVDIYTCKKFPVKVAVEFTRSFFKCKEIVFEEIIHGNKNDRVKT